MKASHLIGVYECELNRLRKVLNFIFTKPNSQHSLPMHYWAWFTWVLPRLCQRHNDKWFKEETTGLWNTDVAQSRYNHIEFDANTSLRDRQRVILHTLVFKLLLALNKVSLRRDTIKFAAPSASLLLFNASFEMWIKYPLSVLTVIWKKVKTQSSVWPNRSSCTADYVADTWTLFLALFF